MEKTCSVFENILIVLSFRAVAILWGLWRRGGGQARYIVTGVTNTDLAHDNSSLWHLVQSDVYIWLGIRALLPILITLAGLLQSLQYVSSCPSIGPFLIQDASNTAIHILPFFHSPFLVLLPPYPFLILMYSTLLIVILASSLTPYLHFLYTPNSFPLTCSFLSRAIKLKFKELSLNSFI